MTNLHPLAQRTNSSLTGLLLFAAMTFCPLMDAARALAAVPAPFLVNYDEGFDVGYTAGYDFGYTLGYGRGETEGTSDGEARGFNDGWDNAYEPAYDAAYDFQFPVGHIDGYEVGFNTAAEEGFKWASEVHHWLTQPLHAYYNPSPGWAVPLVERWGNPSGWGNISGSGSSGSITISYWTPPVSLAARYYDEGYDNGYDEGKPIGDLDGYDEAFPIAFAAAYDPAFDEGFDEGDLQGSLDGAESGYDAGWSQGNRAGDSPGFRAGADFYVAGGSLGEFDPTAYLAGYVSPPFAAASQSVAEPATVPEPSTLWLAGMALLVGLSRSNRK